MKSDRTYKNHLVARNVSRVDCKKAKGWQVRWPGHSKFFSDNLSGGDVQALKLANTYREANFPGVKSRVKPDAGIKIKSVEKKGRNGRFVYVVASHPCKGEASKRFYVGTENGLDSKRLEARLQEARNWRARVIANHNSTRGLVSR